MSVLAQAPIESLEAAWAVFGHGARYRILKAPEVGLVMVRARAGGTGSRFNLGEMTATRCTVELDGGAIGQAWVGGRRTRHAEVAAAFDAMLQDPERRPGLERAVIAPLAEAAVRRRAEAAGRAATTRVEFFTMVRGEG